MKKFLVSLLAVFASAVAAHAQAFTPQLGAYTVIDDVPAFIFYIDETGEHGLAMSFPAIPAGKEKDNKPVGGIKPVHT